VATKLAQLLQAAHDGDPTSLYAVSDFLSGSDTVAARFDPHGSYSIITVLKHGQISSNKL
jgi:hypothetical protein